MAEITQDGFSVEDTETDIKSAIGSVLTDADYNS